MSQPSATVSREEYERETALAWGEVSRLRKDLADKTRVLEESKAAWAHENRCAIQNSELYVQASRALAEREAERDEARLEAEAFEIRVQSCYGLIKDVKKERDTLRAQLAESKAEVKRIAECEVVVEAVREIQELRFKSDAIHGVDASEAVQNEIGNREDELFAMPLPYKGTRIREAAG